MDTGSDSGQWQDYRPELLCLGLRCPVCLDFYEKPHTLKCGHSFCLRCLRTLAKMARSSSSRPPIDRLRFRCPACRKMTVARPLLRRRAPVTIALQDIVDAWFSSPFSVGELESITLRSIASQTSTGQDNDNEATEIRKVIESVTNDTKAHESNASDQTGDSDTESDGHKDADKTTESIEDVAEILDGSEENSISSEEVRHLLIHRFPVKSTESLNSDIMTKCKRMETPTENNNDVYGSSDGTLETSSSEEESEPEIIQLHGNNDVINDVHVPRRHILRVRSFITLIKLLFSELCELLRGIRHSPCRLGLTLFWFSYSGLVIYLSRGFLPWMTLYTVVYFLIMYAEMSRPFLMRY